MGEIVKKPQQNRSIQTRRRIIEAGFQLLSERGYYHITTADIAKAAGVSTGILYRYFNNKLDIVNEIMIEISGEKVVPLIYELKGTVLSKDNLVSFLNKIIDEITHLHEEMGSLHDDMKVLLRDPRVNTNCEPWTEQQIIGQIEQILNESKFPLPNIKEKVHLAYQLIESYCHNKVLGDDHHVDYGILKEEVVRTLVFVMLGHL